HPADDLATALLAWAPGYADLDALLAGIRDVRLRLAELRRADASLTLATAHGTKGLEWDHVAVIGMEVGRFPSRRSVDEAAEPARALEEERRLAYVAWTRARRSLTLLYDPTAPSRFLLEAFSAEELAAVQ
ncbi:MAG TPA: 3'-5' exonuclease, partial [Vitreimonas sp.]|nr:3'-5' exonuclease [Vitreimonas sp.]